MKDPASRAPKPRIPWWGRLEVRVVAALALLGTLCVGASAYLIQLTVGYFDLRTADALERGQALAENVEPFHHALVEAHIAAYQARSRAMGLELAIEPVDDAAGRGRRLDALLEREPDVVALAWQLPDGGIVERVRQGAPPEGASEPFEVVTTVGTEGAEAGSLRVVFAIDPEIDARFQRLGDQKRAIQASRGEQDDIERAVIRVLGAASAGVLLLSMIVGIVMARATTRKASELSRVMARVAEGDLSVRSSARGRDELGQLARTFNAMLDDLQAAQEKLAYLQRIGAWQEMARRIAHEIKNPLTPIQLAVQQLREKDPGSDPDFSRMLRSAVEIVEDEVEGLRRMVGSFSQFAKVPEVRLEDVSVSRILHEFERAYGHVTDDAHDELVVRAPEVDVTIPGDRQLLKQVLVNLVENAVLSAREAGRSPVTVEVSTVVDGAFVEIRVDDNGPGVPPERREAVFEPYQTSREHGTGLGLAIVKKVVLDHGGEVRVTDGHLGGARFRIRLPRRRSNRT